MIVQDVGGLSTEYVLISSAPSMTHLCFIIWGECSHILCALPTTRVAQYCCVQAAMRRPWSTYVCIPYHGQGYMRLILASTVTAK